MSHEPVIHTHELTKKYGDFVALDSLTISLEQGQILGFIGPNGAGKTTTIKILVGLSRPTSGQAFVAGRNCEKDVREIKRLIGYMPDVFGVYDNMRVREYLDFFGAAFKIPRALRAKRIDECLEITGSAYMSDRYVEALSHGMKQRVALARTLLHDPKVLILDEPANGLDPQARIEMREVLLRLSDMGKTLIVTSHILPELARVCDTVAIVTQGRLRMFGTLDQIMKQMRQRRLMEMVLVRQADVVKAAAMLRDRLSSNDEVKPSEASGEIVFSTGMEDGQIAEMLAGITAAGVAVLQFREVPLDLEDAFLEVTRSQLGGSGERPAATQTSPAPGVENGPGAGSHKSGRQVTGGIRT
jgi:ABC-2 type transport system ATP-binding protein